MASGRMEFHAESIMQHANFSFVLTNDVAMEEVFDLKYYDRDPMNLILLHGLTGTDTDWLYGGVAQLMAIQYNLNVFMPTTGNSFGCIVTRSACRWRPQAGCCPAGPPRCGWRPTQK